MATDVRNDRQRTTESGKSTDKRPSPKRRRLLIALVILILFVWLLPPIAARTPLVNWAVNRFGGLNGTAEIQSVSLGWFSPVSTGSITVKDRDGQTIASLASVNGERSLLAIACDYTNLGRFHLRSPKLSIVVREDGSNVEDLLANYLKPTKRKRQPAKQATSFALRLDVDDGNVTVVDQTIGRTWQVEKLDASFDLPKDVAMPILVQASVGLTGFNPPAKLSAGLKWTSTVGEAKLTIDQFPLDVFRPVAHRLVSRGTNITGRLSSDLRASWGGKDGENAVLGGVSLAGFSLVMPELLGSDRVQFDRLQAAIQASHQSDRLDIEKATVDCDVGSASLVGTIPLNQKDGFSFGSLIRQRQQISGRLDLASLARMLPATLHLKQNTRIDQGQVQATLACDPGVLPAGAAGTASQGVKWHAQLDTTALSATTNGRQISWPQPITAVLDAHDTPQGPIVDNLRCQSDFLDIRGAGTPDDFSATIGLNLNQLAARLGQFLNLGSMQLAGQGSGTVNWKRVQQQFGASGQFRLDGFQWAVKGKHAWREDVVTASLSANGQTSGDKTRIDAASFTVLTGADRIAANLTSPVTDLQNGPWPVHVSVEGQLRSWPTRLAGWLPPNSLRRIDGAYNIQADGMLSAAGCAIREFRANATPLIVDSTWAVIDEPQVVAVAAGSYDSKTKSLELTSVEFSSSTVTAGLAGRVMPGVAENEGQFKGQINYDLARLCNVLSPQLGTSVRLTGRGSSDVVYAGPLGASALATGQAQAGLKWDQAVVGGLALGRGEVKASMQNGAVQVTPLELMVNQGRVHLAPRFKLRPDPVELTLPAGPLAERVQIDPAMCASMLKYAAPALADVSTARGTFSVYLDSCRIPLSNPKKCDVSGKLVIHTVEIASGAMLKELSVLLGRDAPARLKQESVVNFRVQNGRVHHDNMELQFPDITIRTSGWVGFDKSLDIVAEMPVPPKWLVGNTAVTQAMRNQIIRLPIRNTLDKPQLDRKEMERVSQQFLRRAAGNLIDQGLKNGLDQLFKPRK